MQTKIYSYGCLAPRVGQEIVWKQLRDAHRYRNKLIELELARREAYRTARRAESPTLENAEKRLAELNDEIESGLADIRMCRSGKGKDDKEPRKRVAALKVERKSLGATVRDERKRLKELCEPANREFERRVAERCSALGYKSISVRAREGKEDRIVFAASVTEQANEEIAIEMLGEEKWPPLWRAIRSSERQHIAQGKIARAESGLPYGTYQLAEDAHSASIKGPENPRYRRFDGNGRIGVILRNHNTVKDIFDGKNTFLKLEIVPDRKQRQRIKQFAIARICVGTGRSPIWAEFPMVMHRPLPNDCQIKRAWILIRRVGLKTRYDLQLTLELPEATRTVNEKTIAVDIGWRTLPDDSVRVAYAVGDQGEIHELVVPTKLLRRLSFPPRLRSFADQHFDVARAAFIAWLDSHEAPVCVTETAASRELSLPQYIAGIAKWRAHGKLAILVAHWRDAIFTEKEVTDLWRTWRAERILAKRDLFSSREELATWLGAHGETDELRTFVLWLEWWRRKDAHLTQWRADVDKKARGARRHLYRNWAANLAREYGTLLLEKWDMRKTAKKPQDDAEQKDERGNPSVRTLVSPSELRMSLTSAFGKDHTMLRDAKDTTRKCTQCGYVDEKIDAKTSIVITCPHCRHSEDQDWRAGKNLQIARTEHSTEPILASPEIGG